MALWISWARLGDFGAAVGAPKCALGSSGGVLNERARALEGSRERPETENRDFGALLEFSQDAPELTYIVVLAIF